MNRIAQLLSYLSTRFATKDLKGVQAISRPANKWIDKVNGHQIEGELDG